LAINCLLDLGIGFTQNAPVVVCGVDIRNQAIGHAIQGSTLPKQGARLGVFHLTFLIRHAVITAFPEFNAVLMGLQDHGDENGNKITFKRKPFAYIGLNAPYRRDLYEGDYPGLVSGSQWAQCGSP
jgi:hypothetical protein